MKPRQKLRTGIIMFSFMLFPAVFFYLSPAVPFFAASDGILNGSLIMFVLLFISALFFGRGFCGWVCPAAGCQEAIFPARDKKVRKGYFIKWIIWIPWITAIVVLFITKGGVKEIDFFYKTAYGLSVSDLRSFITYLFVLLLLIVLPAYIVGKRSFCHHLCWISPFMILGRKTRNTIKWPSLQLRAEKEKCSHCHICTAKCPMSLPVEAMVAKNKMETGECILCGVCTDECPEQAIHLVFK